MMYLAKFVKQIKQKKLREFGAELNVFLELFVIRRLSSR